MESRDPDGLPNQGTGELLRWLVKPGHLQRAQLWAYVSQAGLEGDVWSVTLLLLEKGPS